MADIYPDTLPGLAPEFDAVEPIKPPLGDSTRYRKMFDEARDGLNEARDRAFKSRDYYDDKQLNDKQRRALRARKQPEAIRNRIKPAVNGVLGILEQSKVDPRAYPRNPADENSADVASKTLRFIADKARFHKQKIDAADNHLVEGVAAGIVGIDDKNNVTITRIRYEEFFFDPRSREADYKDALYMGIGKWMASSQLAAMYPDYAEEIDSVWDGTWSSNLAGDSTWEDKPDNLTPWIDKKSRRVMAVEMYHLERDGWRRCVFFAGGTLEEGPSPYLDEDGEPTNPIEASSCFIDRDLVRYGIVQSMLPLQDELNARASRLLHLTNTRQLQVPDINNPPQVDANTARAEAAKADGVIPTGYNVVPTADLAAGNAAIMQEVAGEIDRQAPTPAVLGRQEGASQSGRSRLVLQQAGMTELARALGRFEDWENRMYRQMWMRARQFWTDPDWIRVTDEEGAPEFIQINEPVTVEVMGPEGVPIKIPTGEVNNRLAQMDMDIDIDTVPDTANLAAEQFELLVQFAPMLVPELGGLTVFDTLLSASSIPGKSDIREKFKAAVEERQQAQQAQQQAMQEAAMQQQQIESQKTMSEAEKNMASAAQSASVARLNDARILETAASMAMAPFGQQMPS